jgi:hypothetical protein
MTMRKTALFLPLTTIFLLACNGERATPRTVEVDARDAFWDSLEGLCGQAFAGIIVESVPPDTSFAGNALVMHVRQCDEDRIRIPFSVGEDRSRTWIISKTPQGLRLKHDHRHEDGSEDPITMYGGDTAGPGSTTRQEFPADAHTTTIVPAAATNVWTLEILPDSIFAYDLRREGSERRFRVEFDLTQQIPAPPPPWGF